MANTKTKKPKKGFLDGYKTYEGPRGNSSEWRDSFFERMGLDKAIEILGETDPLTLLKLAAGATWPEVQKAYKREAMHAHPDRGGSHELMKQLNAAFELLEERMNNG